MPAGWAGCDCQCVGNCGRLPTTKVPPRRGHSVQQFKFYAQPAADGGDGEFTIAFEKCPRCLSMDHLMRRVFSRGGIVL